MVRETAEKILASLEAKGLFQSYSFCRDGERLQLLGEGSISYVYEVYDRKHPEKRYALKIIGLKDITLLSEKFYQMVVLQQKASENSGYVASILACEEIVLPPEQGGLVLQCVLMEKLERLLTVNESGQAVYLRKELENLPEKIRLVMQIAEAIMVLHRENILHRDIKLENVFYDAKKNCYKLGDFSVSTYTETGRADDIVYTTGYGAPELERRTGDAYDDTADIYSFGIVIYVLMNHLKFPGSAGYAVNPVQYTESFLLPACEEADTAWTNLIRKMCNYQKELRYQSMEDVMEELHRLERATELSAASGLGEDSGGSTILYRNGVVEETNKDDRYEKKGILSALVFYYENRSKWYGIALSVLFALLLGTIHPDMPGIRNMDWKSLLMLCLAGIEVILLYFGELHLLFGAGALLYGICFIVGAEYYMLYAVLLLGIWYGIPMLGTAGLAGIVVWNILKHFGWEGYQSILNAYHLEWVLVTLVMFLISRVIVLRQECAVGSRLGELWERIWYVMVPVAFLLLGVVGKLAGMPREIMEVFGRIHPGRVGAVVLLVNMIDYVIHRNYPRLGDYMWNEYLEKRGH